MGSERAVRLAFCAILAVFGVGAACAQSASFSGIVKDPTGASVPNVRVVLQNEATKVESETRTGADGSYLLPSLQPGRYLVTLEAPGFRTVRQPGLELAVSQAARLDYTI